MPASSENAIAQADLTAIFDRLFGRRPGATSWASPHVLQAVLDVLDLAGLEMEIDFSNATPAAGRQKVWTVPSNELWRVWGVDSENSDTAVTMKHRITVGAGYNRSPIGGSPYTATKQSITMLPRPLFLRTGGEVVIDFGAGALNDDTSARLLYQRFSL